MKILITHRRLVLLVLCGLAAAVVCDLRISSASGSRVEHIQIASQVLGGMRDVNVYIPQDYDAATATRYPSIYLLHGAPGTFHDWTDAAGLQATADILIRNGQLPPALIIIPDGNYGALGDSQWVDGNAAAGFGAVETYITAELIPGIDARYRTQPDRLHRVVGGLSAGAYGAMNLAVRHSDLFSIVAVHSGFYRAQPTDDGTDVFAGDVAAQRANSPIEHLDEPAVRQLAIYFDVGSDDPWFLDDGQELDQAMTARGIPHEFHIFPGGHTWEYWTAHSADALRFIAAHLPPADPAPTPTLVSTATPQSTAAPTPDAPPRTTKCGHRHHHRHGARCARP